jgi:protein SCO1
MLTWTERRVHLFFRILIPIIVTLGILLMPSCAPASSEGTARGAEETGMPGVANLAGPLEGAGASLAASGLADHSLFHLESEWLDQTGSRRTLRSLEGRVQLVSMVYTNCAHACPRILGDMKRIERELVADGVNDFGFVLVSIDPERDSPERMARFAADLSLDPERWTLLSAPDQTVLELAAVLGVRYARESATDFGHTNLIAVLTPGGEVAHRQIGTGSDVPLTVAAVRVLVEG